MIAWRAYTAPSGQEKERESNSNGRERRGGVEEMTQEKERGGVRKRRGKRTRDKQRHRLRHGGKGSDAEEKEMEERRK